METKIIDNYEEFSGIKKEWDVLLTNSRANLLFLTFEWLSAWWKYYGQGNKLLIILVIDRGKIMAAAPLMIKAVRKGRFIIGNKLQFIAHENSDYMDFIISEQDEECFKLIFGEILSRQKEWDWLDFIFIPENSPHIELWKKYALKTRCLNKNMREISESASLNLRGKYDSLIDFEKSLSNKRRNDLKRCSRLLHKEGAVSYFRTGKITDTEALFSRFVGCHKKRWTKNRKKSIFDEYLFTDYLLNLSRKLSDCGWFEFSGIKLNDEYVALAFGFIYNERYYYYMPTFDPKYYKYSPGNLLIRYLLESFYSEGKIKIFDLLRGNEPYKYIWAKERISLFRVRMYSTKINAAFIYILHRITSLLS